MTIPFEAKALRLRALHSFFVTGLLSQSDEIGREVTALLGGVDYPQFLGALADGQNLRAVEGVVGDEVGLLLQVRSDDGWANLVAVAGTRLGAPRVTVADLLPADMDAELTGLLDSDPPDEEDR